MSKKSVEEFNKKEMRIYEDLCAQNKPTNKDLRTIGNMDEVRKIFKDVVEQKEQMLEEKASTFIPIAKDELNETFRAETFDYQSDQ